MRTHFLSEAFIRVLGWLMCPRVFCMLADGACALGRNRGLGRIGAGMLLYFGAMSLLSMLAGLLAGWVLEPGIGPVPGGVGRQPGPGSLARATRAAGRHFGIGVA